MLKSPRTRYRLGQALIWVGVLAWGPYLLLRLWGYAPSLWAFLPFHLTGVLGGARLKAAARRRLGLPPPRRDFPRLAGRGLIALGALVWAVYFTRKLAFGHPVDARAYLPFHLTGVLGGSLLLLLAWRREEQG